MNYLVSKANFYILKLFYRWFARCFLGIAVILLLVNTVELLRRFMTKSNMSMMTFFEMLILGIPNEIDRMLPFITLCALVMAFIRLNQQSEITILRTAGVSTAQMILGVMGGVLLLGIVHLTLFTPLRAILTERLYFLEETFFHTKRNKMSVNDSGLWLKEIIADQDRIFHAERFDLDKGIFYDVSLYIFNKETVFQEHIFSKQCTLKDRQLFFQNTSDSAVKVIATDLTLQNIRDSNASPETLSFWQMPRFINILEKAGLSTLRYRVSYHKMIAQTGLLLVMVIFAAVFCLRPGRVVRTGFLIGLCMVIGIIFHFFVTFLFAFGLAGKLSPLMAAWFPSLIGAFVSLTLLGITQK